MTIPQWGDGGPLVAIASLSGRSTRGPGDVAQVWILREDVSPLGAIRSGADRSICGACRLRGGTMDHGRPRRRAVLGSAT